eukprot:TRINITY_DN15_c0_g1_i3.p1 TRINITY_DN15_c0_g1~~TRINITY_DN15_c0_g1_i3.p1  ORF type:complete len:123 (-),score=14.97 TRINITY_DN15_c0_g1_i3:278-646(-)
MIRRPPRSTQSRSSAASDVYKRQMLYFRTWSTCMSLSQAPLCHYTLRTITNRSEGTFRSLRYSFGGDHPSQTTHHTLSSFTGVSYQLKEGWYFKDGSIMPGDTTSQPPTYPTHLLNNNNVKL